MNPYLRNDGQRVKKDLFQSNSSDYPVKAKWVICWLYERQSICLSEPDFFVEYKDLHFHPFSGRNPASVLSWQCYSIFSNIIEANSDG